MSHYLRKIRIKNYRSIKEVELLVDPYSPLIGANNAGKSNILNAIQWFAKAEKLESGHFNDPAQPVEVEGEIVGVTEEILASLASTHGDRLRPFVKDGILRVRRRMDAPGAASAAKLEIFKPETGEFEVNPTGIPAAIQTLFPEPVRVDAMVDAPEDASKNKSTTTLGRLIAKLSEPLMEGQSKKWGKLFDEMEQLLSADGNQRPQELIDFDTDASAAVQTYFPGIELSIHFDPPEFPDVLKAGTVRVKEDGGAGRRKFEELGHGAQRSIQMALVQLLASRVRSDQNSPRCTLLLIDEPELYLHPQAIELVRLSLKRLATSGYQVIFSTHSPFLIEREDLPNTSIVSKPNLAAGTTVNPRISETVKSAIEGDTVTQARVLFELGNSKEILFCQKVLLVEGVTEPQVFPSLYRASVGRTLREDKTGIVRLSGSGDMKKALQVLETMGVSAFGLVDLDYPFTQGVRSKLIEEDDSDRITVKDWFHGKKEEFGFELGPEGFPTKKSQDGSEGSFRRMADDPANDDAIQKLHQRMREQRIWFWRRGSIEQVMGIDVKNDSSSLSRICLDLEEHGSDALNEPEECAAFFQWLRQDGQNPSGDDQKGTKEQPAEVA